MPRPKNAQDLKKHLPQNGTRSTKLNTLDSESTWNPRHVHMPDTADRRAITDAC